MLRALVAFAALAVLAACATTSGAGAPARPPPAQVAAGDGAVAADPAAQPKKKKGEDWICYYERPIGSNIPEQVCRPKAKVEEDRARTQDMLRTMPNPNVRRN